MTATRRRVFPAVPGIDQHSQVIDVLVSEKRDLAATRRFFTRALDSAAAAAAGASTGQSSTPGRSAPDVCLIEAALGASVDGLTKEQLWRLSRGNILYLRKLVRGGRQTGGLACVGGMWHWIGPVSPPPRLVKLIQARIGDLPAAVRVVGELVAFGEPLEISVLARAGGSAADIDAAERAGLLITELVDRDVRVRLGHPLFGEVIRAQTPLLRRRTLPRWLAEAADSVDGLRDEDIVRVAIWHLEAGTPDSPRIDSGPGCSRPPRARMGPTKQP